MTTRICIVQNATGIHTRPARNFVDTATQSYPGCEIKVIKGDRVINGKSVLSMLTLGAKYGEQLIVEAQGEKEAEAIAELGDIFEQVYQE